MFIWDKFARGPLCDIFGIGGVAQAVGGVAGAGIQAGALLSAANTQADSTRYAVDNTSKTAANSLAFNQGVYDKTNTNEQPYRTVGAGAAGQLGAGLTNGSLTAGYGPQFSYAANPNTTAAPFSYSANPNTTAAPFSFSGVNLENDPAYQFDLQQGQQAEERSAAARGGLISGGALKDLNNYTQGYASNQFQNSFQNASNTYQQNYGNTGNTYQSNEANAANIYQQNYGNTGNTYQNSYANALAQYQQAYNQFEAKQGNTYNRLAATAGLGQNAVTQSATSGNAAASNNAAVAGNAANSIANLTTAQGTASAASIGSLGNAISGGVNSLANSFAMGSGSSYNANNAAMGGGLFQNGSNNSTTGSSYTGTPGRTIDAYGNTVG